MKIGLFTNTFTPHVGGVARSTQTLLEDLRRLRHRVLVVAPEFPDGPAPQSIERSVERVPAWQNFNGSDFSVRIPVALTLSERLAKFDAGLFHAHHPFLLGDTALRMSAQREVPIVFTHHTKYEDYTHYVSADSPTMRRFVINLSTYFSNCCHGVIAPSESIAELIRERGVESPIHVIPTGIDLDRFGQGRRDRWRQKLGIPDGAVVVGHVGRLAQEKNLSFLSDALIRALRREQTAHAMIVGDGDERPPFEKKCTDAGVAARVHFLGQRTDQALMDAYAAMDLFAFSSQSETQGMVVAEAMAAGNPVVALDAPGVREVVIDRENGRLLKSSASAESLARALTKLMRDKPALSSCRRAARQRAKRFDRARTARETVAFYDEVRAENRVGKRPDWLPGWSGFLDRVGIEYKLLESRVSSAVDAIG